MKWDDERVDRAIRAADPAAASLDEGKSQRAQLVLDEILNGRRTDAATRFRPRRSSVRFWAPAAAVLVLVLVMIVAVPLTSTRAVALTPPVLTFDSRTGLTVEDLVDRSITMLSEASAEAEPARGSRFVGWYLDATITDMGSTAVISPQITSVRWNPDLSGRITIVAGEPYSATGGPLPDPRPSGTAEPGTVLSDMTFEAGEYQPLSEVMPGDSSSEMRSFLASYGLPSTYNAGDIMLAVGGAFGEWTLSDRQHASILRLLADAPGAEVLGSGTDRAGRRVWGVRGIPSQADGASSQLMLISADTGRIVGLETMLTRAVEEPPLKAGSVISYTMWDTNEGDLDQ